MVDFVAPAAIKRSSLLCFPHPHRGCPLRIEGDLRVQGRAVAVGENPTPVGEYVRQHDLFLPCMTALETLQFYAQVIG